MRTRRPTLPLSRPAALPAALLAACLALAGCAGPDEEGSGATAGDASTPEPTSTSSAPSETALPEPTATPEPTPTEAPRPELEITVAGDEVSPNAAELRLGVGETLLLRFDADRPGELHVHSKPEQYVDFTAGTTTHELVVNTPGTVEIEEHDSGAVVALVEVS
ncbi:MAG: hypothetical protein OSB43_00160 [Nocardioides sp.]|uniref:hypothetical protein n=1 Tax=Nocardioides sp. TaxID=35761 RepID=UPI002382717C|nr:hypothetical protein [Nocardioides sp.]MDE0774671.1 hypothetical protein [Nocardioides sp.]